LLLALRVPTIANVKTSTKTAIVKGETTDFVRRCLAPGI
jgi:hypothetical protein